VLCLGDRPGAAEQNGASIALVRRRAQIECAVRVDSRYKKWRRVTTVSVSCVSGRRRAALLL